MSATLNGSVVTRCTVHIPAWGLAWADVEAETPTVLAGSVSVVLEDLTLRGTVMSGGAVETRKRYRIAGGAGGWGRTVPAKHYQNDAGVKYATILGDVAAACGETMGTIPSGAVGPHYTRPEGPASAVLEELFPKGWYVDEAGVTHIGRRAAVTYEGSAPRTHVNAVAGRIELAPAAIATLLPGAVVDGVEAVDVEHVLDGKLRTTIYGRGIADSARLSTAFARIVEAFTDHHRFFAPYEYRVVLRSAERLRLQVVRVSTGMPDIDYARVRPGVAGLKARPALGSLVLVSFVNGDPSRPVVTAFDDPESPGFVPDAIYVQAGSTGTDAGAIEHATSAEALVLFVKMALDALGALAAATTTTPVTGAGLASFITTLTGNVGWPALIGAVNAASLSAAVKTALLAALAGKSADTGGDDPGIGWPNVRGG